MNRAYTALKRVDICAEKDYIRQMNNALYAEAETEFGRIAQILGGEPSPQEIKFARTLAWRMWRRMEEIRNRHPVI